MIILEENSDVDSIGFSKQYPKYYFDKVIIDNQTKYCAIKISDKFTLPKSKIGIWFTIKVKDTEKYDFRPISENADFISFKSKNFEFLDKYCFSFVEHMEDDTIYFMYISNIKNTSE